MQLLVTTSSGLPIYRQIMRQIVEAIATGRLHAGDKLPSHRDLAQELVIAPLTVKKAYDELESQGYIETQRGRGTFIAGKPPEPDAAARREELKELTREFLSNAYLAGLDTRQVNELVDEVAAEMADAPEHAPNGREGHK